MTIEKKEPMMHIGLRIPRELRDKALKLALKHDVTPSDVIRQIIEDFFSNDRSTKENENNPKGE